jgi:hypothetical protein
VDAAALALGRFGSKIARSRGAGARFGAIAKDRIHVGAGDVGERKVGSAAMARSSAPSVPFHAASSRSKPSR